MKNRFEGKKILVTGASGLIGSNLSKSLLFEGAKVIAMGRSGSKIKQAFANELSNENFSWIEGSVVKGIPRLKYSVDYIFNAASPMSGAEINSQPVDVIEANIKGTQNCLELLRQQGSGRLIVFSSITVYGKSQNMDVTATEKMTNNADVLDSTSAPYSEAKRLTEVLVRAYISQFKIDAVISRISTVYGHTSLNPNTAFYEFINKIVSKEDLRLSNTGLPRRDNIYIDDVIEGLKVIAVSGLTGEAYNLASNGEKGNYLAVDEIALKLVETANLITGNKLKVILPKPQKQRHPGIKLDNSKLKGLGWKLDYSVEEGIKKTLEKYLR